MKKILFLDRNYCFKYIKSDKFESIFVAVSPKTKKELLNAEVNVVGCFEEEYEQLPIAEYPTNYLLFSFDSDRFLNSYPYFKRREILGKEISFWTRILDEYKPDLIVNEVCTMELTEVLYIEAKKREIPYHTFLGLFPGKAYWVDEPFNSMISEERWNQIELTDELLSKAEELYDNVRIKNAKPLYAIVAKRSVARDMLSAVKYYVSQQFRLHTRRGFVYEQYVGQSYLWIQRNISRIFRRYDILEQIKDTDTEVVFYPLHFEPEATISYFVELYMRQVFDIEQIAHCLGQKQVLVVKEHPQQPGMLLTKRFQEIKKRCPNVLFLSSDISSYEMFKTTDLVVTLVGTAGYEAMIMGIPTIVLGDVFYRACPCVTYCESFRELKRVIRGKQYNIPTKEAMIPFLARFAAMQTNGHPNLGKENVDNIEQVKNTIELFL